jgi:hypothetical protein
MHSSINTYLSQKANLLFSDERQAKKYIAEIKSKYSLHDLEQTPVILLTKLTKIFPLASQNENYELGIQISTAIQLFSELKLKEDIIEIEILSFLQNKLIPYAKEHNDDLAVNNTESIIWGMSGISTNMSKPLIENICTDPFFENFDNFKHIISACLFVFKRIIDQETVKFFNENYSKIKDSTLHNEDALVEKVNYYKAYSYDKQSKIMHDYYEYLLRIAQKKDVL